MALPASARADAPQTFSGDQIIDKGHQFFGGLSGALADLVQEGGRRWGLPIILGESDPEGCAACPSRTHPENAYRDGALYGEERLDALLSAVIALLILPRGFGILRLPTFAQFSAIFLSTCGRDVEAIAGHGRQSARPI